MLRRGRSDESCEAFGQDVKQEATQKLYVRQRAVLTMLGSKGHLGGVAVLQACIGDADAMGVSAEVAEDLVGAAEGPLRVDDPTLVEQRPMHGVLATG